MWLLQAQASHPWSDVLIWSSWLRMFICFAGISDHPLSTNGQRSRWCHPEWRPVCLHPTDGHTQHTQEHGKALTEAWFKTTHTHTRITVVKCTYAGNHTDPHTQTHTGSKSVCWWLWDCGVMVSPWFTRIKAETCEKQSKLAPVSFLEHHPALVISVSRSVFWFKSLPSSYFLFSVSFTSPYISPSPPPSDSPHLSLLFLWYPPPFLHFGAICLWSRWVCCGREHFWEPLWLLSALRVCQTCGCCAKQPTFSANVSRGVMFEQ